MASAGAISSAVRDTDPDRHLSVLYAPADRREALLTLYAFDAEVAALRDKVREPMAGEIRLQWWRDALAAGAGESSGHPVADALRGVMARFALPAGVFDRLLEARIFDLYDDPMPDRATLEGYLGETRSVVFQLAALILDPAQAQRFAEAAGHAGCAAGIAELVRAVPLHRRRGQCFVPADLLAAAGTTREALLEGRPEAAAAVAAMVALGREHFGRFRRAARDLPHSLRPAFLPLASVEAALRKAEKLGAAALARPVGLAPIGRHWRMMRRAGGGW